MQETHERTGRGTYGTLRRIAPKVIVLIVLGAVGLWGHQSGWRAPRFSSLFGSGGRDAEEDWCVEHRVPESRCVACNPSLVGADPEDWCREHGVPESKCSFCHPEILRGGVPADWCAEHGVPESQCTLCNPSIAVKGISAPERPGLEVLPGDRVPTPNPACTLHEARVQFASPEAMRKAGIELATVEERRMPEVVTAAGEIEYDGRRIARITARAAGTAWLVAGELGETVKEGQVLAIVDSAEAGRARMELLQVIVALRAAEESLRRLDALADTGLRTQSELLSARASLEAARVRTIAAEQALVNLGLPVERSSLEDLSAEELADEARFVGLPPKLVEDFGKETKTANLLPVTSPLDGTVVSRDVVAGESVDVERALFIVADTSRVWTNLDVRLEDAGRLALGQPVVFRPDGDAEHGAHGTLAWISTEIDEKTRTVQARADLENPEGRLLVHSFGAARIKIREEPAAAAVPEEAVQWEGCCRVVFVAEAPLLFRTRKVRLGALHAGAWEVIVGVAPGELVVTRGSALLRSEILKSRLGAGCAGE